MLEKEINALISYGLSCQFLNQEDVHYVRNRILAFLSIDSWEDTNIDPHSNMKLEESLNQILFWKFGSEEILPFQKEIFTTELINLLLPRPSETIRIFQSRFVKNAKEATDWFYDFSSNSNYIKDSLLSQNIEWTSSCEFGSLLFQINVAKPEKDPREIALSAKKKPCYYPKCLLCHENEGYQGNLNHPDRANLRIIPILLNQEKWFFQFSPYAYYSHHAIIFRGNHSPMKIDKQTFYRLTEFVDLFPHYFIGSNADLPIVGGSMLSHDHYQGGEYYFPIDFAKTLYSIKSSDQKTEFSILNWPLSSIRIVSKNKENLINHATEILDRWQEYNNSSLDILSKSHGKQHNTITPFIRKKEEFYVLTLILRNNRTNETFPYGIFHVHPEIHPIKKENIGIIEAMGKAILPKRMLPIIEDFRKYNDRLDIFSEIHGEWVSLLQEDMKIYPINDPSSWILEFISRQFIKGLEHCGVFKLDSCGQYAFREFLLNSVMNIL